MPNQLKFRTDEEIKQKIDEITEEYDKVKKCKSDTMRGLYLMAQAEILDWIIVKSEIKLNARIKERSNNGVKQELSEK